MKVAVLTSSRADFGIYLPLLRRLKEDPAFELEIIAFGTHVSAFHGFTLSHILEEGFEVAHRIESLVLGDTEEAIATAMATTLSKFGGLWASAGRTFDLVFCLGDRYEMFAAVASGVPFNLTFAHIHGGEDTLGAMDDTFRHCLTLMSSYHFTTTRQYAQRVKHLVGTGGENQVHHVGSLSLDNLEDIKLLNIKEFRDRFGIDLSRVTILFTYHPETVNTQVNDENMEEILQSLDELEKYQVVITMPNADTRANCIRSRLMAYAGEHADQIVTVETLGTQGYFSCMEHAAFVMGNSSSGIIEAASFGKYVINIGDRQKGRAAGKNVMHVEAKKENILEAVGKIERAEPLSRENLYWNGGAADKIVDVLKKEFGRN